MEASYNRVYKPFKNPVKFVRLAALKALPPQQRLWRHGSAVASQPLEFYVF